MNVPAASPWLLLRARARLLRRGDQPKTAVWHVINPGEDGAAYGLQAPDSPLDREKGLFVAEELAVRRLSLVFFVGPSPTLWPDIFDATEILRMAGVACVLATSPKVLNPMSAPVIAYHFSRIILCVPPETTPDQVRAARTLTNLWPRGPVETRIFGKVTTELVEEWKAAGVCRVLPWPPPGKRKSLIVSPAGEIQSGPSPWCADHVWL